MSSSRREEKRPPTRSELRKMVSLAYKARAALDVPLAFVSTTVPCSVCETKVSIKATSCPDCGIPTKMDLRSQMRASALCNDKPWMNADVVERLGAIVRTKLAYNAEQRRRMAKSGTAMKNGSFPIANCVDAENAIHAQGRAKGSQDAVVAHIRKRVASLGCSGTIFDKYK